MVALYVSAWIEMLFIIGALALIKVALYVSAWIEIKSSSFSLTVE